MRSFIIVRAVRGPVVLLNLGDFPTTFSLRVSYVSAFVSAGAAIVFGGAVVASAGSLCLPGDLSSSPILVTFSLQVFVRPTVKAFEFFTFFGSIVAPVSVPFAAIVVPSTLFSVTVSLSIGAKSVKRVGAVVSFGKVPAIGPKLVGGSLLLRVVRRLLEGLRPVLHDKDGDGFVPAGLIKAGDAVDVINSVVRESP